MKIKRLGVVLFNACLLGALCWLFYSFIESNARRIEALNGRYAEDAARQIAAQVGDKLLSASQLVDTYAYFIEHSLSSPEVAEAALVEMEKNSPFDAVRYVDKNGALFSSGGEPTPDADRDFYRRGISGESGVAAVFKSASVKQGILGFYTPIRFERRIIGVLIGSCISGGYLRSILNASYFGEKSDVFLCDREGRVIAASSDEEGAGDALSGLAATGIIGEAAANAARKAVAAGEEGVFESTGDAASVCVASIPGYNFFIIQVFPQRVTTMMIDDANRAGFRLEGGLLALFAIYVVFLTLRARRQKKALLLENREFANVIEALNSLFAGRYCLADLSADSYELVGDQSVDAGPFPPKGTYKEFVERVSRWLAPEDRREFKEFFSPENLRRELSENQSVAYEIHLDKKGVESWENLIAVRAALDDDVPARVLFARQDVTEMKLRELGARNKVFELDRKERQYRTALASNALCRFEYKVGDDLLTEDIIMDVDGERVSLIREVGLEPPCAASSFFAALAQKMPKESREEFLRVADSDYLLKQRAAGRKEIDTEYWRLNSRGEEICVRTAFYLTGDESGDVTALVVARDVTESARERQARTRALKNALAEARRANEAKTTFLSSMSHDIRTPMNAIIGFATIASEHLDNKDQTRECLRKVLASSNHLLRLINDILDMSRIESGKISVKEQDCDISSVIHDIVGIIQPQAKAKKMRLLVDAFGVVNEDVKADPLKLNQIFINLLSNAVKYTPSGGLIEFRITQKPSETPGVADYQFVIRDNGVGMSGEFVKHIFEPFTRETTSTVSGVQGTGLGMAITKNIVKLLNGSIEVESEPGKGSSFTVTLPLKLRERAPDSSRLEDLAQARVLVVDDDYNVSDSLAKMLKELGMRPDWTTSGREAVYRARQAARANDPYKAYILDWQMPGMSGEETTRSLREMVDKDAPIVLLTSYDWADIAEDAQAAGATAFCPKPLFMSDLKRVLLSLLQNEDEGDAEDGEGVFENARVLVVDDVEMNRELAEYILAENGFAVETAADGTDAVEMTRKSPEGYYDAILMDVQMPTMDGYEATRTIRALPREDAATMPIIAMTANAFEEDKAAALKVGMNAHVAKPIDVAALKEVLKKYFAKNRKKEG